MSSWADISDDHDAPVEQEPAQAPHAHEGPPQRRKLQLKPRSAKAATAASISHSSSKSNPFGAAKPREEVLASKGIDAKAVDNRIEKKAHVPHFTKEQETELDAVRAELSKAETDLRNANEQELPEEKYRVVVEQKRKELNDLTAKYTEENEEKQTSGEGGDGKDGSARPSYERPSERRRRLEEEGGGRGRDEEDNAYASFGGRRHGGGSHEY